MKRKWFTLLFALLAVASFRVTAQTPDACISAGYYWIQADTTGLALSGQNPFPYSGNKSVLPNWFIYEKSADPTIFATNTMINDKDGNLLTAGDIAQYKVTQVGSNDRLINFVPKKDPDGAMLSIPYGGNDWTQFEVVQFGGNNNQGYVTSGVGFNRTTQVLQDGMEGYLMPAQGGSGVLLKDTTASMLIVVADKDRNLLIKPLDSVFVATPSVAAGDAPLTMSMDSFNCFNFNALDPNDLAYLESINWLQINNGTANTNFGLTPATGDEYAVAVLQPGISVQETQATWGTTNNITSRVFTTIAAAGKIMYFNCTIAQAYGNSLMDPVTGKPDFMNNPEILTEYIGPTYNSGSFDPTNPAYWTNGVAVANTQGYYGMVVLAGTGQVVNQNYTWNANAVNADGTKKNVDASGNTVYQFTALSGTSAEAATISYTQRAIDNQWRPVYIKLQTPAGHWATPADFQAGVNIFPGLDVAPAAEVKAEADGGTPDLTTYTNRFTVTQVDYIARTGAQSSGNIFGVSGEQYTDADGNVYGTYYTPKFGNADGGKNTGLQMVNDYSDGGIIPLFTLQSGCDVVSVSRQNGLAVQSQGIGVRGNRLELREYGHYFDYFDTDADGNVIYKEHIAADGNLWDAHNATVNAGQPLLDEARVATSLQKFAIWVDECGNMTLYPVAAYSWVDGPAKDKQVSTVAPNSVLLYNNLAITATAPITSANADKNWGNQIGMWDGLNAVVGTEKNPQITTAPNVIDEDSTNYSALSFIPTPYSSEDKPIDGKFFFLEVPVDKTTLPAGYPFTPNAYQDADKTTYVLSTQVYVENGMTLKKLVVVPKERVRRYTDNTNYWYDDLLAFKAIENADADGNVSSKYILPDYWSNNPYDLVNMAAHWEINKLPDGKFQLVNMLGDVLEYNAPASGFTALAGGFLPENSNISGNGGSNPIFNNVGQSQWFASNPVTNVVQNEWTASSADGTTFTLNSGNYTLKLSGEWYQDHNSLGQVNENNLYGKTDSIYYQQDVILDQPADAGFPVKVGKLPCPTGLALTKAPIYYVPNYSGSFGTEDKTLGNTVETINTSDPSFKDGQMVQDSLTAYLYLNGTYGIKEATAVDNGMLLGSVSTDYLTDPAKASAAALDSTQTSMSLQFIPLVNTTRNADIKTAIGSATTDVYGVAIETAKVAVDTLYGETYKWFIVENDKGQYLVFDTINPGATDNRLKVAFTFESTGVENATPVRLYQPLVGDKLQGNFIFQFQIPYATYDKANKKVYVNVWPQIDGITGDAISSNNLTGVTGGQRVFGQLSNQSNFIQANGDKSQATRFTYRFKQAAAPSPCECPQQFIDPDWMAGQKLLGLPLQNQIWDLNAGTGLGFATGGTLDNVNTEATVQTGITELTFTYADSIRLVANADGTFNGVYTYVYDATNGNKTVNIFTNRANAVPVPLYYIQNDKGQYLTVSNVTYLSDPSSTITDVSGANLIWVDKKYGVTTTTGTTLAALQLFAISGNETSGQNADGWYTACQSFVYLPLASYKLDYTHSAANTATTYNGNLGIAGANNCGVTDAPLNDVTTAFRVGYYSKLGETQQNLAVMNASGSKLTSMVPVSSKWNKLNYDTIGCPDGYQLVQDLNSGNPFYYANGGVGYDSICTANSNTVLAHWAITHDATDPQLHRFVPETLVDVNSDGSYSAGKTLNEKQTVLNSPNGYYVQKINGSSDTIRVFDFGKYNSLGNYYIGVDTFVITCINHTLPYYNLEPTWSLPAQLAILEAPYVDRNLTDFVKTNSATPSKSGTYSYQTYLNQIDSIDSATYLTAYPANVRALSLDADGNSLGHDIPYYAFSITKDGTEYFLEVHNGVDGQDSVYWTTFKDAATLKAFKDQIQNDNLAGVNKGSSLFWNFKFCLPYQMNADGTLADSVTLNNGVKCPPVYIQTLDPTINDVPYLVIAGAATKYATAVKLSDALATTGSSCSLTNVNVLAKNIYSMDYSQIDPYKVTAWIFGGQQPNPTQWVPLRNELGQSPYTDPDVWKTGDALTGLLSNFKLADQTGVTFVTNSNQSPVDYGVFTGIKEGQLLFEYEGTEQIGSYGTVPIYYYRIGVVNPAINPTDTVWMTDSYGKTGNYLYTWPTDGTVSYNMAFFGDKLANGVKNSTTGALAYDNGFLQTLGLRYVNIDNTTDKILGVGDGSSKDQIFVVVSNADYTNTKIQETDYRYLAGINNRLVFYPGIENALVFQFGQGDTDNGFTGVQVVGTGEVFGVTGGVRLLNQAGSVANLYSVDGSLLKSVQVTGADQTVDAPRGIVIVKVADKATKVIVK